MRIVSMALILVIMPLVVIADDRKYHFPDRLFLGFLGLMEGPDGYDDITGFARIEPKKPITSMTVNEVLEYQRLLRGKGSRSSAVGRYQFIHETLLYLTRRHDIDREQLFDSRMQDYLSRMEMIRCGFYEIDTPVIELGNCLARIWAALPLLSGSRRGQSRYRKTGINRALTSPRVVEALLRNRAMIYQPRIYRIARPGFNISEQSWIDPVSISAGASVVASSDKK